MDVQFLITGKLIYRDRILKKRGARKNGDKSQNRTNQEGYQIITFNTFSVTIVDEDIDILVLLTAQGRKHLNIYLLKRN